jgi:hypothetical protein
MVLLATRLLGKAHAVVIPSTVVFTDEPLQFSEICPR